MRSTRWVLMFAAVMLLCVVAAAAAENYFQGFEVNMGDWVAYLDQGIRRVPSGGGVLHLTASSSNYYAEIQNKNSAYSGYLGMAGYSYYGGLDEVYRGDFYQAIDVYIDVNWSAPNPNPSMEAFWIDMAPYPGDNEQTGARHNFRVKALGGSVELYADDLGIRMATLRRSGWYTFLMTWRKGSNPASLVITDMYVFDKSHQMLGTAQVLSNTGGFTFLSSELQGNGYIWITAWQNGFADDVLALDNQRTGLLLPAGKDQCKKGGWQTFFGPDGVPFKNQGDCVQYVNTGK